MQRAMTRRGMLRLIGIVSVFILCADSAFACIALPSYDPYQAFEHHARGDIVAKTEVIVEGVVEPYNPAEPVEPNDYAGFSRMHVDRIWKGAVAADVIVLFQTQSMDCSQPPPFGERIRFAARLIEKRLLLAKDAFTLTPQRVQFIETHDDFLIYNRDTIDLPLQDPELDRLLGEYQAETEAMKGRADSGDHQGRLAFAAHLFDNNERHRALTEYEGILRDNPSDLDLLLTLAVVRAQLHPYDEPEATLASVERTAPQTPEWQGKIAHARFVATGRLTDGWKDWADLKPAIHCEVSEGNFDGATFDRANLAACEFVRSSFRNASFLHTDLSGAYFEASQLTGAKYDCATRLPQDFDPVAAGMINVAGKCDAP